GYLATEYFLESFDIIGNHRECTTGTDSKRAAEAQIHVFILEIRGSMKAQLTVFCQCGFKCERIIISQYTQCYFLACIFFCQLCEFMIIGNGASIEQNQAVIGLQPYFTSRG